MSPKQRKQTDTPAPTDAPWDKAVCLDLLEQLWLLRRSMLESEQRHAAVITHLAAQQRDSARNLAHYLALRSTDLRALQAKLSWLGVSSLGHAESHVLANVDKVIGILHRLSDQRWQDHSAQEPAGSISSRHLLQHNAEQLLGAPTSERAVRIMVTLPSEAASDYGLVRRLVQRSPAVATPSPPCAMPGYWSA